MAIGHALMVTSIICEASWTWPTMFTTAPVADTSSGTSIVGALRSSAVGAGLGCAIFVDRGAADARRRLPGVHRDPRFLRYWMGGLRRLGYFSISREPGTHQLVFESIVSAPSVCPIELVINNCREVRILPHTSSNPRSPGL